jgi:hypothetical protein
MVFLGEYSFWRIPLEYIHHKTTASWCCLVVLIRADSTVKSVSNSYVNILITVAVKCKLLYFLIFIPAFVFAQSAIHVVPQQSELDRYAAQELQRYVYLVSGELLPIKPIQKKMQGFVVGTLEDKAIRSLTASRLPAEFYEGYSLQTKDHFIVVSARTSIGLLYGVYGLLEDHYGVGFYLGHDAIPRKQKFYLPRVDEVKNPSMKIRGFLPWTNFPQSATVYSWEDWKFIIDQAAKMRMNFIHVHNYNGEAGHNEMFHNFTVNGITSRVWMPTAKTGHGWSCKGFDVKNFRFGGEDLFDDYDFGADCALHNETLTNELVFRKGVSLFARVIAYAHTRGVKIGLGLDIDLIVPDYKTTADDPAVVKARLDQVLEDYPDLDYLILFISENILTQPDKVALWRKTFDAMYAYLKSRPHTIQVAVAGWGLSKEMVEGLPTDVIIAPISKYSDKFEDGSIYGNREFWGCPWLERDFFSSEYYYPYNMHLSNTIAAWQARSKNMTGFYTLTWRLTDAIDPKMSFIAKAPWDSKNLLNTSKDVYLDYATKNYGAAAAEAMTSIINENEPLSCSDAECQPTGVFSGTRLGSGQYLLNFQRIELKKEKNTTKLFAVRADSIVKAGIEKREDADSCVAWVQDGARLVFKNVDLTGVVSLTLYSATANPFAGVDVRIGNPSSKVVITYVSPTTAGWHNWQGFPVSFPKTDGIHDLYISFKSTIQEQNEEAKTSAQLRMISEQISNSGSLEHARRMGHVASRLKAADLHLQLNRSFPNISKPSELTQLFSEWTFNFLNRVTDISSLGNVQSIQNRYIQERYLQKEEELLRSAHVKFPTRVQPRGTSSGVLITWRNNEPEAKGFYLYANGKSVNQKLISNLDSSYIVSSHEPAQYSVTAISSSGIESDLSPSSFAYAGTSDKKPPLIVVVSPPGGVKKGTFCYIKVRLVDDRAYELQKATLHYRKVGTANWFVSPLSRRVKAVFAGGFLCDRAGVYEYFVSASDGSNEATFPVDRETPLTVVVEENGCTKGNQQIEVQELNGELRWNMAGDKLDVFQVYRSQQKDFNAGPSTFVTYLPPQAQQYQSNMIDFNGDSLKGTYYHKVILMDSRGCIKAQSASTEVRFSSL